MSVWEYERLNVLPPISDLPSEERYHRQLGQEASSAGSGR